MKRAVALLVSATTVLFVSGGMVVGCGSDNKGGGSNTQKDSGADSGADSSTQADSGSDAGPPQGPSPFGGFCDSNADCDDGLICLTETGTGWFGGGPAGGFCTLPCANDATVCQKYPNSTCVGGSSTTEAYCFENCQRGPELVGESKCHDRANSACFQVSTTTSACLPTCGYDGECPDGRFCDLSTGVCVDDQPTGLPIGSECDPNAAQDPCAGFCITLATGYSVCSGFCTFGAQGSCRVDPDLAQVPAGAATCLPLFDLQNDDQGDTGLCIQRCDCNDNCLSSQGSCSAFDDADIEAQLEAKGLCVPSDGQDPGLVCEAGDGGDSGASDSGAGTSLPDGSADAGDAH